MSKVFWTRSHRKSISKRPRHKLSLPHININFSVKPGINLRRLLIVMFTPLIVGGLIAFLESSYFSVTSINIYGTTQLRDKLILSRLDKYVNKNIFSVNPLDVKSSINSSSVFLKDTYVEKHIPNTIYVYIVERFPKQVIINLQGAYLIDNDNIIIKVLSKTDGIDLSPEELDLFLGFTGYDSPLVRKVLTKDLSEEEILSYKFSEVDSDIKQHIADKLVEDMKNRVHEFFNQNTKAVSTTKFANLERIFILNNHKFKIGGSVSDSFITFPEGVIAYFREKKIFKPVSLVWRDKSTLEVNTLDNKQFIFSSRLEREFWKQTNDLDNILHRLEVERKNFTKIDVTVPTIGVE